jgi:hypothetical protein
LLVILVFANRCAEAAFVFDAAADFSVASTSSLKLCPVL